MIEIFDQLTKTVSQAGLEKKFNLLEEMLKARLLPEKNTRSNNLNDTNIILHNP